MKNELVECWWEQKKGDSIQDIRVANAPKKKLTWERGPKGLPGQ